MSCHFSYPEIYILVVQNRLLSDRCKTIYGFRYCRHLVAEIDQNVSRNAVVREKISKNDCRRIRFDKKNKILKYQK